MTALALAARDSATMLRRDMRHSIRFPMMTVSGITGQQPRADPCFPPVPEEFAGAVTQIDEALKQRIRELAQHRRKLAELAGGERLFLPPEIVEILDELRAMGVRERTVQIERDGWILVAALSPELVPEWVSTKRAALADPEFRRIYLLGDQALDWDPADPRIAELADAMADWAAHSRQDTSPAETSASLAAVALMASHIIGSSPSWERLNELSQKRLEALRAQPAPPVTGTIEIRGPRLLLRAVRPREIDEEWQAMRDADPMALAELPDEPGFRARLRESGRLVDGHLDLAIDVEGLLIGRIQTFVPPGRPLPPGTFDVGIGLREHARGRGYGREALALLTGWLFKHAGAEVIEGSTDHANAAMRTVFQRSGWASSGPVTEFGRDWDVYRITRDDWRARSRGAAPAS